MSLEPLYPSPQFSLTNQNAQPFGSDDLRGSVWIADFIFVNCAGPCPRLTQMMATLQHRINRPDVKLVSFSVDPDRDTPEALKAYGEYYKADFDRWNLMTGDIKDIYAIAAAMKITAIPADDANPIIHSSRFLLVDRRGLVRGIYEGLDPDSVDRLVVDAALLASEAEGAGS